MRGTPGVNLFIKCPEPCVNWTGVRRQSYFHLFCVSPSSCSFSPLPSGLSSLKAFPFLSKDGGGEGFEDGSLVERVGGGGGGGGGGQCLHFPTDFMCV